MHDERTPTTASTLSRLVIGVRALLAALLLLVAAVAATAAVLAHWADAVLLDTDTFVAAIEPVVGDDGVRDQATETIADAVVDVFDVRALTQTVIPGLDAALAEEIATGFESFVRETISSAVGTDEFEDLWLSDMRLWHVKFVGAVRADDADVATDGVVLRITLGPYIDLLAEQAEGGIVRRTIMGLVPEALRQARVVVFDAELVADRLALLRDLESGRPYLPWIAASAFVLALLVAPGTAYALFGGGIGLLASGSFAVLMARAEADRVESLIQSAFSASPASAARFTEAIFGPLEWWFGYLALVGGIAALLGALAAWRRTRARGRLRTEGSSTASVP